MQPSRTSLTSNSIYDMYIVVGDRVDYKIWVKNKDLKYDLTKCLVELVVEDHIKTLFTFVSNSRRGVSILDPKSGLIEITLYGDDTKVIPNNASYSLYLIDINGDRQTLITGKIKHITPEG